MKKVEVIVTNEKEGLAKITSYPYRPDKKRYEVPLYKVHVKNVETKHIHEFKAIRFGVKRTKAKEAHVVGLQDEQEHVLQWNYITTMREMAWRVYSGFFIHRDSANPLVGFGSIGCVEICGVGEWNRFNTLIKQITECSREEEVGSKELAKVIYKKATRPKLKLIP
ncbi:hypothetical protein [Tenacibaculum sp.]|uniref:hypothetical protein n=1 Tax=Tenacibaculum sp. TaxID=1906242 RepID=UPI003AA87ADA